MSETIAPGSLICPKCGGAMRSYERSGITVDQCTECRGVFLDRGELERLIDAEGAALQTQGAAPAPAADEGGQAEAAPERGRREGFLSNLFEGFGGGD